MVPPGGVHLTHPDTSRAARILGIDYSDAVTGFEFKGRHGTAIVKGAVIAEEFREALTAVLTGLEDERRQEEEARRTLEALRMWKRLLTGLKIRQRIDGYEVEGERDGQSGGAKDMTYHDGQYEQDESYRGEYEDTAGGFIPVSSTDSVAEPTASGYPPGRTPRHQHDLGIGNFLDQYVNPDNQSGSRDGKTSSDAQTHQPSSQFESGGGFMIDSDDGDEAFSSATKVGSLNTPMHEQAGQDSVPSDDPSYEISNDVQGGKRKPSAGADPRSLKPQQIELASLLNDDELEDATTLQRLYEAEQSSRNPRKAELYKHDTNPNEEEMQVKPDPEVFENGPAELAEVVSCPLQSPDLQPTAFQGLEDPAPERGRKVRNRGQSKRTRSSSLESKGSLLSCDPDDVDAEPDWLD